MLGWRRLSKRRDKSAYVSCINHASRRCSATVDRKEGMSSLPVVERTRSPEWLCLDVPDRQGKSVSYVWRLQASSEVGRGCPSAVLLLG